MFKTCQYKRIICHCNNNSLSFYSTSAKFKLNIIFYKRIKRDCDNITVIRNKYFCSASFYKIFFFHRDHAKRTDNCCCDSESKCCLLASVRNKTHTQMRMENTRARNGKLRENVIETVENTERVRRKIN